MRIVTIAWLVLILVLAGCASTNRVRESASPVILYELRVYRDGGSLGFVIGTEDKEKITFVVDGKIGSPTAGYFFLNTLHTDYARGTKLPLGGREEQRLLRYLSSWLHATFTDRQLRRISKITDFRKRTREEFHAWHIQTLLKNRAR